MTVTPDVLAALEAIRVVTHGQVDDLTRVTIARWAAAWDELAAEWAKAMAQVLEAAEADAVATGTAARWPSRGVTARLDRVQRALAVTRDALEELAQQTASEVATRLPQMVDATIAGHADMIAAQMPPAAGTRASLAGQFGAVSRAQVEGMVRRSVELTLRPLEGMPPAVMDAVNRELVRGVAVGANPRAVAQRMTRRLEGRFNGGAARALTVARTEMLDAVRSAGAAVEQRNASVLQGWQWLASLDRRTCPSCWAQHGSVHPITESGPDDHQNGRCDRVPVTRSWADLGFPGIAEPASAVVDAQAAFADLSAADQVAVMGPGRLALLRGGQVSWSDLSQQRDSAEWRRSFSPTPVADLLARAA